MKMQNKRSDSKAPAMALPTPIPAASGAEIEFDVGKVVFDVGEVVFHFGEVVFCGFGDTVVV
jgi:hypothetical protein